LVLFESERSPRELTRWVYQNMQTGEAVDLIAHSLESYERVRKRPFFRHILSEGKVLYERSPA
jgi:hypothetical protein